MRYAILLIVTLLINNIHIPFISSSDKIFNFVYDVEQYCLFIFLFAFIYHITPRQNFKGRAISLVLMLMFINLTMNTIYDKLDIAFFYIQYPLGIVLFLYLIYTTVKWDAEHQPIEMAKDKSYFVFKKPKNFVDFLVTIFKSPVSSFSIVNNTLWYKFSKDSASLCCKCYESINQEYNIVVEVDRIDMRLIRRLRGTDWTLCKSNCITAFKPVFKAMNIKLGRFDFIPAVFAYKFFKGGYRV